GDVGGGFLPLAAGDVEARGAPRHENDGCCDDDDRSHSVTRIFMTAAPPNAACMPSVRASSGIVRLTSGANGTAPLAARRMASSHAARVYRRLPCMVSSRANI